MRMLQIFVTNIFMHILIVTSPLFYLLQVFRTDLITAMKLHDSYQLNPEDYYELADPWRQEWEKGVQVPVSPESIPQCTVRYEAFFLPVRLFLFNGCT